MPDWEFKFVVSGAKKYEDASMLIHSVIKPRHFSITPMADHPASVQAANSKDILAFIEANPKMKITAVGLAEKLKADRHIVSQRLSYLAAQKKIRRLRVGEFQAKKG